MKPPAHYNKNIRACHRCEFKSAGRPSGDEKIAAHDAQIFQTCDLALSVKAANDYSVISTW